MVEIFSWYFNSTNWRWNFSLPHMIAISIKSFSGEVDMERLAQICGIYIRA